PARPLRHRARARARGHLGQAQLRQPGERAPRRRRRLRRFLALHRNRYQRPPVQGMVKRGFTLIELLVVLAIVATLLTLAVPRYFNSVDKSKEAVLKENLFQMRDAISRYHADRGKYPDTLDALATDKYLRK